MWDLTRLKSWLIKHREKNGKWQLRASERRHAAVRAPSALAFPGGPCELSCQSAKLKRSRRQTLDPDGPDLGTASLCRIPVSQPVLKILSRQNQHFFLCPFHSFVSDCLRVDNVLIAHDASSRTNTTTVPFAPRRCQKRRALTKPLSRRLWLRRKCEGERLFSAGVVSHLRLRHAQPPQRTEAREPIRRR